MKMYDVRIKLTVMVAGKEETAYATNSADDDHLDAAIDDAVICAMGYKQRNWPEGRTVKIDIGWKENKVLSAFYKPTVLREMADYIELSRTVTY